MFVDSIVNPEADNGTNLQTNLELVAGSVMNALCANTGHSRSRRYRLWLKVVHTRRGTGEQRN